MGYTDFSNKTKNRICRALGIIPDRPFLRIMYRIKTGRTLHLNNPVTYSEKLNWLKIYDRNPLYTMLADKYRVRDYVREKIGEKYLVPLLGVWDSFDEIDFDSLPERFVLKCTHDFGSAVIVNDRKNFDKNAAKKTIEDELKYNFFYRGREWAYKDIKPRIIGEANIQPGTERLADYKFFCFGGIVKFMYIASGRGIDLREDYFDREFNYLDTFCAVPKGDLRPEKPENLAEMIAIAEKLSQGINNVRVDLYNVSGRIYFGEMTFYHAGGMAAFSPAEMDEALGKDFIMEKYQA